MTHAAVSLRSVEVSYGANTVVHGVSLAVAPGEQHVLLGESGSGKTTLLRAIAGFEAVSAGAVIVDGQIVDDRTGKPRWVPPEKRDVGVVFQDYALFSHLDVAGNVGFGIRGQLERVRSLLAQVGLAGYESRPVSDLSGGEQQRVALARALARQVRILLLDEPFSNLNPALRHDLRQRTVVLLREQGIAGIFVTHDRREAFAIADRVSVIRAGRLLQTGTCRELYEEPASLVVARSMGDANALPATPVAGEAVAECALGRVPLIKPATGRTLIVRPEQLTLVGAESDASSARVQRCVYYGDHDEVQVRLADGTALWAVTRPGQVTQDSDVSVQVTGSCVCVDD